MTFPNRLPAQQSPLTPRQRRRIRSGIAALAVACLIVTTALVLYIFDPQEYAFYPRCPTYWLLGIQCPGCGSTRALHQLLRGNVLQALRLNPVVVLLGPLVFHAVVMEAIRAWGYPRWRARPIPDPVIWGIAMIFVGYGIMRNLI